MIRYRYCIKTLSIYRDRDRDRDRDLYRDRDETEKKIKTKTEKKTYAPDLKKQSSIWNASSRIAHSEGVF